MNDTEKSEFEHEPEDGSLVHLPTEIVLREVDRIVNLPTDAHNIGEKVARTRETLGGIAASFATWDLETRRDFMVQLVTKEYEVAPKNFDEFCYRRDERAFPLGVNFSNGFLRVLPPSLKQEALWITIESLSAEINFDNEKDQKPAILRQFVSNIQTAFSTPERRKLELELTNEFVRNNHISSDGRYQVVYSWLNSKYSWSDTQTIWGALQGKNVLIGKSGQKLLETTDSKGHFLDLQQKIAAIVADSQLKSNLRKGMLHFLVYEACSPEMRSNIEKLILEKSDEEVDLSLAILHWLGFLTNNREDKGERAFGVLQKVVTLRQDMPELQLAAMQRLMLEDSSHKKDTGRTQLSDVVLFVGTEKEMHAQHPHLLEERSGISFFSLLASFEEADSFLNDYLTSEDPTERFLSLVGVLARGRSELINREMVSRVLNDVAEFLEAKKPSEKQENNMFALVSDLKDHWNFSTEDIFLLRRIQNAVKPFIEGENSSPEAIFIELKEILDKLQSKR